MAYIRIPIPGRFVQQQGVGLGDVVKRATTAVGISPCGGCQQRAQALNSAVQFVPWNAQRQRRR